MGTMQRLQPFINGQWVVSKIEKYLPIYNPSTGEIIAEAPCCTKEEVESAVTAAKATYPGWSNTSPVKRVRILHKVQQLIEENTNELALSVARENGKAQEEAQGDILKAKEGTELAYSIPSLLSGIEETLRDASSGYDTVLYRESIGVFAGIIPFNFPAMIPTGWMTPQCVICGSTIVIEAASFTPMTVIKFAELYRKAGFLDGVINIVTCSRHETEILLTHPDVVGISFAGSTQVGLLIYSKVAQTGKRVQTLCEAKNRALVLEDSPIQRTAAGIINASLGCAEERCMALLVVCVQESIADELIEATIQMVRNLKIGLAHGPSTNLGSVTNADHKKSVLDWIELGIKEGVRFVLDGRGPPVPGCENGFYLGPTIFGHVEPGMIIGEREISGPVLCFERVKDFEGGVVAVNTNPFANGSVIFTQSGHHAREFVKRTGGGMVSVNAGIPVPVGVFPFSGHKRSFFDDLHCLGRDGIRFYTETKSVATRWFDEEEKVRNTVSTWDGTIQQEYCDLEMGGKKMPGCRRALTMILALVLSITTLAGHQSGSQGISSATKSESSNQPIILKRWFWPDSDMHIQVMQSMVDDFNVTNGKNIKVELEIHPWDGGQYNQDLFTAAMGGGASDAAGFKLTSTPLSAANHLLEPLDSYIDSQEDKNDIQDTLYKTLHSVTKDGNLYLVPWNAQILYIYYRPSMFQAAGINIPKTYEEFLQDYRKLTHDANGDGKTDVYGYGIRSSKGGQEPWGSFTYARDRSSDNLASDTSTQGMQDFIDLFQDGCAPPSALNDGFNEIIASFRSGLTAMTIQHIGTSVNMVEKFGDDVSAFAFPDSPRGRWTSMGDTETVVFSGSKNKEAAFEWMSYLATGAGRKAWCVRTGDVPVSKIVQQMPEIQSNRFMKISIEGAPLAGILPILNTTIDWINNTWSATIWAALLGKITTKETMEQLDKTLYSK